MKHCINTFLLLFITCSLLSQETIVTTLEHNGIEREYTLYVPQSYSETVAAPLVFNFHGYTSNMQEQMFYGDFRPLAEENGFLVVHPQGTLDALGTTHFNVGWGGSTVDDVGFTSALIDHIDSEYNINLKRVYSTGMSNGGFMSYRLACELSDKIAAIASVTGSMSGADFENCNPTRPMPVLEIHGDNDPAVPYNGNFIATGVQDVLSFWVDFNNCDETATTIELEDIDMTDESTATFTKYDNGDNGVTVEHFRIINGGHTWPGSIVNFSVTNYDINASAEIWKFFSKYNIDGLIESTLSDENFEEITTTIYPVPATDLITIEHSQKAGTQFQIFSTSGQLILQGNLNHALNQVDTYNLNPGIYILKVAHQNFKFIKS